MRENEHDQPLDKADEDDLNLDDVTTSQQINNFEAEYEQEEEEKENSNEGPSNDNHAKSEQVANWIVENELNTCI